MNNQERDAVIITKLNEGMSLSDVQKLLAQEYNVRMTYLELRLLAGGLAVDWQKQDKPKPAPTPPETSVTEPEVTAGLQPDQDDDDLDALADAADDDLNALDDDDDDPAGAGATKVTIDPAPRPGMALSGMVRFASGIRAGWMMDRMGRLNLDLPDDAEQPGQEDLQAFQDELRQVLQRKDAEMRQAANDGRTKVTINPVVPAGVKVGGNVEFASGAKGDWYVDNGGRLGFTPAENSTQPTPDDIARFQVVLQQELRKHGYGG